MSAGAFLGDDGPVAAGGSDDPLSRRMYAHYSAFKLQICRQGGTYCPNYTEAMATIARELTERNSRVPLRTGHQAHTSAAVAAR